GGEQRGAGGEGDEVAKRHAEHFLAVAQTWDAVIVGGGEDYEAAFARLDAEDDNIRAAFAWAADAGELELEVGLVIALRWYWLVRGHPRGARSMFERAGEDTRDADDAVPGGGVANAGAFPYPQGGPEQAEGLGGEALARYPE